MAVQGRRNRIKYFLLQTVEDLFNAGVNRSKHEIFKESYEKNRTRESPFIHSYSTKTTYEKVVAKYSDFLKEEYGLRYEKDFRKLSVDEIFQTVDRYFEVQKEKGLAQNTLEKHISGLKKVLGYVDPDIKEYFTPDNRMRWRDGVEKGESDRYGNSDKIIENLYRINEVSAAIAELQRTVGCRVGDVKKIEIQEDERKVVIHRSKGGRDRTIYFEYFPEEQFEKVKQSKEILDRALEEKSFSEIRKEEYYKDLRKAVREVGEPYYGAHPFRYEFAQNAYQVITQLPEAEQEHIYRRILEERGKPEEDINKAVEYVKEKDAVGEAIVSELLGHSRLDISRQYLKLRAR